LALILAACAGSGSPKPEVAQNVKCVPQTGSRIPTEDSNYTSVGRCYSSTDVERTGAATSADALRLLDPALTISR
jgi:hypothetical protein